jgi:hypothetical protein
MCSDLRTCTPYSREGQTLGTRTSAIASARPLGCRERMNAATRVTESWLVDHARSGHAGVAIARGREGQSSETARGREAAVIGVPGGADERASWSA